MTPAADIYSLAKTIYSLIAGEAPRRYAHHPISALPEAISNHYWSSPLLRVLEKATQTRAENRYQTVQSFWDDLADSTLPPTQSLSLESGSIRRKPSSELTLEPEELTQAPPRPRFDVAPRQTETTYAGSPTANHRARIVVPVARMEGLREGPGAVIKRQSPREVIASFPDKARNGKSPAHSPQSLSSGRTKRLGVALVLVLSFSGMLLATHKYVTSRWNPLVNVPQLREVFVVGREGYTTTDVNLRPIRAQQICRSGWRKMVRE